MFIYITMSHKQNDNYYEAIRERFDELVMEGDWESVNNLMLELQDNGNSQLEVELWNTVSSADLLDYKRWDEMVNGSTENQMDDNS